MVFVFTPLPRYSTHSLYVSTISNFRPARMWLKEQHVLNRPGGPLASGPDIDAADNFAASSINYTYIGKTIDYCR